MKGRLFGAAVRGVIVAVALTIVMAGTAGAAGHQLYFGDLHAHTSYSDGVGTPEMAYAAAKAAGADFFATTDHNHCSYGQGWMTTANWADTLATADAFNEDGVFVTFPGYERWLPWMTTGEVNIFNATEIYGQSGNPAGNGYNNGHVGGLVDVLPSCTTGWRPRTPSRSGTIPTTTAGTTRPAATGTTSATTLLSATKAST